MYFYELFSHSDRFNYRTHIISSATCVLILCTALTFLSPFLLTFYTGDFWIVDSVYSEQPQIDNHTNFILQVDNDDTSNRFFLSSYSTLNRNYQSDLLSASSDFVSNDTDGDGLLDQYRLTFDIQLPSSTTNVRSINLWLIFKYKLRQRQHITTETMALANFIPPSTLQPSNNQQITIYGQLVLKQRKVIPNSGEDSSYNEEISNSLSSSSVPDLDSILSKYFSRNYYTSFETQYTSLTTRTSTTTGLTFTVVMNVGRQAIHYQPGFWQAFKWGWIQYICTLLPFLFVFYRLTLFVFSNNLVRTSAPLPNHRHKA
ncbi:unnamed protein product [Adineta ricciae]|uniref:Transmembrane protein 231 n=1 Tax=Adineta ricciae TaxID=249248 RepID=A0A816DGB8_ADIRI|nr:unnamed protein product [Adineta ricciae]